jgi:hypothetical protein
MQRIAGLPFEPATTHTVVVLHMADDRLNRLSSLEPAALRAGQCLVLSAMNQVYCDTSESTPRNPRSTNTVLGCGVPGRSCNRMELYSSCSASVWPSGGCRGMPGHRRSNPVSPRSRGSP